MSSPTISDGAILEVDIAQLSGENRLVTGMYDLLTGERLMIPNSSDDTILLTTLDSAKPVE